MKWDIEYLGNNGIVGEIINYKNKDSFEKEIHDSNEIGRPIKFKQYEEEQERE